MVRRDELPKHDALFTQPSEGLPDRRDVGIASGRDGVVVGRIVAGLLTQEKKEQAKVEMGKDDVGKMAAAQKQESETLVVGSRRRIHVAGDGLRRDRSGFRRHDKPARPGPARS
jgi:hypothetical protein